MLRTPPQGQPPLDTKHCREARSPCSTNHNPLLLPSVLHQRPYSTTPPPYRCPPSILFPSGYRPHCLLTLCGWTQPPLCPSLVFLSPVLGGMQDLSEQAECTGFNLFSLNVSPCFQLFFLLPQLDENTYKHNILILNTFMHSLCLCHTFIFPPT